MSLPSWYGALLLGAAAFRCWKLLAEDTILDRPRRYVTGIDSMIESMVECPWCLGSWLAFAWWGAWEAWPHWTIIAAAPLAIAALVGIVGQFSTTGD